MKKIELPFLPISTNKLNISRNGRLIKSPEARQFKDDCTAHLLQYHLADLGKTYQGGGVMVSYHFYTPKLYTKKGELSNNSLDLDNYIKALQDVLFSLLGINDNQILEIQACKKFGEPRTEIVISFI
jgi:Holliday junction resolvase RusA-like endonuclease